MILSDRDIRHMLHEKRLDISPIGDLDAQLQPASFDLRLGDMDVNRAVSRTEKGWVIYPGAFTLGTTLERVRLPNDLVGRVEGRSTYGRLGLLVHVSAGFIDPGFEGQITLEFKNVSDHSIALTRGVRISQIAFFQMTSPAERPYGAERGSHYQGQVGTTGAKL